MRLFALAVAGFAAGVIALAVSLWSHYEVSLNVAARAYRCGYQEYSLGPGLYGCDRYRGAARRAFDFYPPWPREPDNRDEWLMMIIRPPKDQVL